MSEKLKPSNAGYRLLLLLFFWACQTEAQNIASLRDSAALKTLQDSFCASISRHAGADSKDWGDAVAFAVFTKLDVNSATYRNAELFLYKKEIFTSMRRQDQVLDSFLIDQSFSRCLPLWTVILEDRGGFYKTIAQMRQHPPLLQIQLQHLREQTGKNLVNSLRNGISDSTALLFDRRSTFDSARTQLLALSKEISGKGVNVEITFERKGHDTTAIAKVKLLRSGAGALGGIRIQYRKGDIYAKIERLDMLLRDSFRTEDLIEMPAPTQSPH
jgi:hypothetical protein